MKLNARIARYFGIGVALTLVFCAVSAANSVTQASATTTFAHHAALVINDGKMVHTACVGFNQNSITGKDVLDLAPGTNPVYRGFGGTGVAVCALCGTGCPSDGSCLTCGGANYWAYYRATSGENSFKYSASGAGGATVENGDVEGWNWGSGTSPPWHSFNEICAGVLSTTTTTAGNTPTTKPSTSHSPSGTSNHTVNASGASNSSPVEVLGEVITTSTTTPATTTSSNTHSTTSTTAPVTAPSAKPTSAREGVGSRVFHSAFTWLLILIAILSLAYVIARTRDQAEREIEEEDDDES